jgi:hypothetical protein
MNIISVLVVCMLSGMMLPVQVNTIQPVPLTKNDIKACIGAVISEKENIRIAKSFNKVNTSSRVEIYIYPECESEVFIFTKDKEGYILYMKSLLLTDTLYNIPGSNKLITFDGERQHETILVVISARGERYLNEALTDTELLNRRLEVILMSDLLTEEVPQMLTLGGNFRSLDKPDKTLKRYTGNKYVYKEYQFDVRK